MNTSYVENRTVSRTRDMVISSLLIAVVFAATRFINIRLPISVTDGGMIHMGNTMLFTVAIVFGKRKGAIAGAFGMGLFDLLSEYAAWTPFTFVIRGVMGYLIGSIANFRGKNGNSVLWNLIAIFIASIWMIGGYYISGVILYHNWISPLSSIPGDIIQVIIGIIAAIPLSAALKKTKIVF